MLRWLVCPTDHNLVVDVHLGNGFSYTFSRHDIEPLLNPCWCTSIMAPILSGPSGLAQPSKVGRGLMAAPPVMGHTRGHLSTWVPCDTSAKIPRDGQSLSICSRLGNQILLVANTGWIYIYIYIYISVTLLANNQTNKGKYYSFSALYLLLNFNTFIKFSYRLIINISALENKKGSNFPLSFKYILLFSQLFSG